MKTKYLDSQISGYRLLDEKGKLPDNGKEQLKELEAIKEVLNIDLVNDCKPIVVTNKFGGIDRLTIEEATKRLNSQTVKIRKIEKMINDYRFE